MNLPDLGQIFKVMNWHKTQRQHKPGESVGVFALLPSDLANNFPQDGREMEDNSPQHITVLYIGNVSSGQNNKLKDIIQNACSEIKPFKVKMANKPKKFVNDKNEKVYHMPIFSKKLKRLHGSMKDQLRQNAIQVMDKYPEYKAHTTLEYVKEGEKAKYKDFRFNEKKEFMIKELWVFGLEEGPILIPLGKR